jgi:hypothetical protein
MTLTAFLPTAEVEEPETEAQALLLPEAELAAIPAMVATSPFAIRALCLPQAMAAMAFTA